MKRLIGILSDAHGNYPAFCKAVRLLSSYGVEKYIFLGDSIGYMPSIEVVMELKKQERREMLFILGNHERMLLTNKFELERDNVYNLKEVARNLDTTLLDFLKTWPTHLQFQNDSLSLLFIHGSPDDFTNGYMYPDTDISNFSNMENYDFVFMGHTHHPFIRIHESTCYVNVGSCGMPRDDGRYGSVAIFNTESREVKILRFDIQDETRQILYRYSDIHSSVRENFDRRKKNIFGEIIDREI